MYQACERYWIKRTRGTEELCNKTFCFANSIGVFHEYLPCSVGTHCISFSLCMLHCCGNKRCVTFDTVLNEGSYNLRWWGVFLPHVVLLEKGLKGCGLFIEFGVIQCPLFFPSHCIVNHAVIIFFFSVLKDRRFFCPHFICIFIYFRLFVISTF